MKTGIIMALVLAGVSVLHLWAGTAPEDFTSMPEGADMAIYSIYKEYLETDYDKAMEYAGLFLAGIDTSSKDPELGRMCDMLGSWYEDRNLFSKAIVWRQRALLQYEASDMDSEAAAARYSLAKLYYRKGEYHRSLQYLNGLETRIDSDNLLGSVYFACGDYVRAYECFQEYASEAEQAGDSLRRCVALNNIAAYYSVMRDTSRTRTLISEALEISRELGDSAMQCRSLLNLSSFQINYGKYGEAAASLRAARDIVRDVSHWGSYWMNWGILLRKTGNYSAANDSLAEAEKVYRSGEFDSQLLRCYNLMIDNYARLSDTAAMCMAAWKYYEVAERISDKETSLQLFQYQNEIIRQKEAEQETERKALRKVYVSVSASILAVLGMGVWLYGRNRAYLVRRKQDELERQILVNRQNEQELRAKNEILELKKLEQYKTERVVMEMTRKFRALCEETRNQTTCDRIMQICSELRHSMESQMDGASSFIPEFNSDFFQKLMKAFPNLTVNERRLCVLLHMNMSTKEISEITRQSPHSINMARARLREKLGLKGSSRSLQEFLSSFG